ncbi:cell division protein FtsZ [Azospirillum sp. RWY-5-1]|uniref:Cell division protein FtsZ n=1 Tax=Azospirillum oleiclasticum TaxID=2735135 RepID=A0ABX2TFN0_9PROT|nr:cell division protein FtsZ [Azospirillum oleiclasticum]NYZ15727.1 cell division protein FtsZ [Azospirillum oleiclasticum]NYZ21997.1 cell division protein FtsZ [Azospirillum oleiclasticum]
MINVSIPQIEPELKPRITVFGVGGAGGNAVNNMIKSNLEGVEFVVGNTDAQALKGSLCEKRIQLGTNVTRGLGAGSKPDVGRAAAEEQIEEIAAHLDGANMVFITAGMGGGTGTGAAPVIARAARERGLLTVGVVTKPFHFEGAHRMRLAENGIAELQQYVDTLIIIPNQNLFRIANEKTTFADAFKMADDVLHSGVRGVTDLMVMPGLINLDFADIRSVMTEMGKAMMGTGEAGGERRAIEAAEAAISNPLLDDVSMKGARGVLINITGGYDMTLFEVDEAANRIRDEVDPDANIIFGSTFDSTLEGTMRVSVVATGIDAAAMAHPRPAAAQPVNLSLVSDRSKRPGAVPGLHAAAPARPLHDHAPVPSPAVAAPAMSATTAAALKSQPVITSSAAPRMDAHYETQHHQAQPAPQPVQAEPQHVPQAAPQSYAAPQTHGYEQPVQHQHAAQPKPAAGPLHGERRDGHFIAPTPADPGPRQPLSAGPVPTAGHDGPEAAAKKRMSLFGLVTGLARRGHETAEPPKPAQPAHHHAPQHAPAQHNPAQHAHAPVPQAPAQPQRQPMMGMEGGQPKMTAADEEQLDIPAFLRRQAN